MSVRRRGRRGLFGGEGEEMPAGVAEVPPGSDEEIGVPEPEGPPQQQHLPLNEVFSKLMSIGVAAKNIKPVSEELRRMVKEGQVGPELAPQLVDAIRKQFGL